MSKDLPYSDLVEIFKLPPKPTEMCWCGHTYSSHWGKNGCKEKSCLCYHFGKEKPPEIKVTHTTNTSDNQKLKMKLTRREWAFILSALQVVTVSNQTGKEYLELMTKVKQRLG